MGKLLCPIAEGARRHPQQSALSLLCEEYSYQQLDNAVSHLLLQLRERGIREGSRVAFVAETTLPTLLLLFALFRLRAIACPLSFRLSEEQRAAFRKALGVTHEVEPTTCTVDFSPVWSENREIETEQWATSLLTSGSSGTPKIACHSWGNHYDNALGAIPALKLTPDSRWLLSLPLFHVSGIAVLFRSFLAGCTVVLAQDLQSGLASATHVSLVPTQLFRLLQEHVGPQLSRLRCVLLGGAPLASSLFEKAREQGVPLFVTYGMTEMSSMITLSPPGSVLHAGKPLSEREVHIAEDGEIWVRGHPLFLGYWEKEGMTLPLREGWFPTKDLGKWTSEGDLLIVGRKDRMFISGGENIQPEEIEQALCTLPGIVAARVVPQADPLFGQRPIAYILEETPQHTLESVREALKGTLPGFKHPIQVLPFTLQMRSGKQIY